MERKYRTTHQGIAAYLVMQGYEILRVEPGTNPKTGRPNVTIEFDTDYETGRQMGDAFYNGQVNGNLKEFNDAQFKVREKLREVRP